MGTVGTKIRALRALVGKYTKNFSFNNLGVTTMALVKNTANSTKRSAAKTKDELVAADGWLNQKIVRSDGSEFPLRKGTPMYLEGGGDRVLEALLKSEMKYRDQCIAEGKPYVARTIKLEAHVQLVLPQADLPDLFE